jgi:DNA polymerase III subunit epsilon
MKILIFDTETIGLPKDYKASYEDVDNWPRIMSLAWSLRDDTGEVVSEQYHMITPDGWEVPQEKFWIDNGYSTERSLLEGKPIAEVLNAFMNDVQQADVLVGHNLSFDHRITWAELIRAGIQPRSGMPKICTMMKSTSYCKIPAANGRGFKWPKLEELYTKLFDEKFDGAHDAKADVLATVDCFFELLRIGVIQLPEVTELATPN